jgi:hypothetical protein
MFPMFHHVGLNLTYPEECDCSKLTLEELSDKMHNCNVFRFLSGFLFHSAPYLISANYSIELLINHMKGSYEDMMHYAHRPMFIASSYGQNSPLTTDFSSAESLEAAYSFCTFAGVNCSFLTFTSYDVSPTSWSVSDSYTLMTNGACTDNITPAAADW